MAERKKTIDFRIVTLEGLIYEGEIDKVTIPTTSGEITVLANHAPMVSVLKAGELAVHKSDHTVGMAVSGGIIEIRPDSEVYIMADTAERAEDIDLSRAEEAKKRAEQLLKEQEGAADIDFARIQVAIEKELARLDVGRKYKNLRR